MSYLAVLLLVLLSSYGTYLLGCDQGWSKGHEEGLREARLGNEAFDLEE